MRVAAGLASFHAASHRLDSSCIATPVLTLSDLVSPHLAPPCPASLRLSSLGQALPNTCASADIRPRRPGMFNHPAAPTPPHSAPALVTQLLRGSPGPARPQGEELPEPWLLLQLLVAKPDRGRCSNPLPLPRRSGACVAGTSHSSTSTEQGICCVRLASSKQRCTPSGRRHTCLFPGKTELAKADGIPVPGPFR